MATVSSLMDLILHAQSEFQCPCLRDGLHWKMRKTWFFQVCLSLGELKIDLYAKYWAGAMIS